MKNTRPKNSEIRLKCISPTYLQQTKAAMSKARAYAVKHISGLYRVPDGQVDRFLLPLFDSVLFLRLPRAKRREKVLDALTKATREYNRLFNRAVEQAQKELALAGTSKVELHLMLQEALQYVLSSEVALLDLGVDVDLFSDSIWPSVKEYLWASHDFPGKLAATDSQRYGRWVRDGDFFFTFHYSGD
jgi:hypothetical protein